MKKFAFKTLSALLAAVLLLVALPLAAFAEDVSPYVLKCDHIYEECYYTEYEYSSNEYHLKIRYRAQFCRLCGEVDNATEIESNSECHEFDDSLDEETETQGDCIYCGETIYW